MCVLHCAKSDNPWQARLRCRTHVTVRKLQLDVDNVNSEV